MQASKQCVSKFCQLPSVHAHNFIGHLQESGDRPQGTSRNDGPALRTSVSVSYRGSSMSRPSTAANPSRISLSTGGFRGVTPQGSVSLPPPDPDSATAQAGAQAASRRQGDNTALVSSDSGMPHSAAQGAAAVQRQMSQPEGSASVQTQGFRGSKQRPHSAQASAKRPLSGSSKAPRRPQSAVTSTAGTSPAVTPTPQPPFWTGCMQQLELSPLPDEGCLSDIFDHDTRQQPKACEHGLQQPAGHKPSRQRPQSASSGCNPLAASSGTNDTAVARSPCKALRTVPEAAAARPALQPDQPVFKQATLAMGRAGSLRAWRGMYTQASTSQGYASHEEKGQNSRTRPGSTSQQHRASRPSTTRPHSASGSTSVTWPNSAHQQGVQQQKPGAQRGSDKLALPASEEQASGQGQRCLANSSLQACTLPRPAGRGAVAEEEGRERAAVLDLTEAER